MKKFIIFLCIVANCATLLSQGLTDVKIYVNPGHGGFTNDDRNIATPGHPTSGHPLPTWDDETGFWESQSNLDKGLYLRDRLLERGANVQMSRVTNTQADDVSMTSLADDADSFGADVFISIHSNAFNGNSNFLFLMYRDGVPNTPTNIAMARHCFPFMLDNPLNSWTNYYPYNQGNVKIETNPLGVQNYMTIAGFLSEGSFHDYVPEACRLMNVDYKHLEALRLFRYFVDYYEDVPETTGTLAGYVKTQDEKMETVYGIFSFTYHSISDDQWRPLNGATVKLLDASGATTIDTYTVDDEYNGIFVFYDLEPGNYKLEASLEGYVSQTVDVTVTAAKTSNQKIFLRDKNFVEPDPDPANYPDPKPDVTAESFDFSEFTQQGTILQEPWLNANNIKRAIQRNGKLYVLSNVATSPKISIYDATDLSLVRDMDLTGISGGQLTISDIAFTSDDKLLACNRQLIAMPENSGRTFKVYIWDDDDAVPSLFLEMTGYAGANFAQGLVGETMAVSGPSWNTTMYLPVISRNSETPPTSWNVVRFISISKETDGAPIATYYGKAPTDQSTLYTLSKLGSDFQITISPRADDYFILTSSETLPTELQLNKDYANVVFPGGSDSNNSTDIAITRIGVFEEKDGYDLFKTNGANYFRYAGRSYMAAPVAQAGRVSAGVVLFDITDGLDNAVKISEQLPEAGLGTTAAPYMAAFGKADVGRFDFSVLAENQGYARFSTTVKEKHTVKFDSKGGSALPDVNVAHGEKLIKPADPILEGAALEGWYINEGELWEINTESGVNFRDAPSTSGAIIPIGGIPNGTQILVTEKVTDPSYVWGKTVYNGYTGWFVTDFADFISEQVIEWNFDNDVVIGDMTLEAHWTDLMLIVDVMPSNYKVPDERNGENVNTSLYSNYRPAKVRLHDNIRLSWRPSEGITILEYEVYAGPSENEMSKIEATVSGPINNGYSILYQPATPFVSDVPHYWRVDAILDVGAAPITGTVWSFTPVAPEAENLVDLGHDYDGVGTSYDRAPGAYFTTVYEAKVAYESTNKEVTFTPVNLSNLNGANDNGGYLQTENTTTWRASDVNGFAPFVSGATNGTPRYINVALTSESSMSRTIKRFFINGTDGAPSSTWTSRSRPIIVFSDQEVFDEQSIIGYEQITLGICRTGNSSNTSQSHRGQAAMVVDAPEGTKSARVYNWVKLTVTGDKYRFENIDNLDVDGVTLLPDDDHIRLTQGAQSRIAYIGVELEPALNDTRIKELSINEVEARKYDHDAGEIEVVLASLGNYVVVFELNNRTATADFVSGAEHNFAEGPLTITVTAEGETKIYTVSVKILFYLIITLDPGEGRLPDGVSNTKVVRQEDQIGDLPVPIREGYDFLGWETETGNVISAISICEFESNVTLFAKWIQKNTKVSGSAVGRPSLQSATLSSITVNAVSPPSNGQSVEYAIRANIDEPAPVAGWQSGTTFSGLNADALYFVFARAAENANYLAGAASVSLPLMTWFVTGAGDIPQLHPLRAWVENGRLRVSGLTEGAVWSVYGVQGALVYRGVATGGEAVVSLPAPGVYIVQSGEQTIKLSISQL